MCQNSQISAASHHDAGLTIILARNGLNHHASLRRRRSTQLLDEALDALIAGGEAMAVHQVLPDRHRVPATRHPQLNRFPVRLRGAGRGTASWLWLRGGPTGGLRAKVGGHLYGRFWLASP